jgi:hypothetical protein
MRAIASIRPDIWCLGKVARLTAKAQRVNRGGNHFERVSLFPVHWLTREVIDMRFLLSLILIIGLGFVAAWGLGLVSVTKVRDGALPVVKAEGGQMPQFDVKAAKIEVGTTNTVVAVPTVTTENRIVETPSVTIEKAK